MRPHPLTALALLAALPWLPGCATAPAAAPDGAGPVEVVFAHPERYRDAGDGPAEVQVNLALLRGFLQREAGRWLQPGQSLYLEIEDVDLAGRVEPPLRPPQPLRVLRGAADGPRIELRYTLRDGAGVEQTGIASVSDPTYLLAPLPSAGERLPYERRMLAQWLRHELGSQAPGGAAPR